MAGCQIISSEFKTSMRLGLDKKSTQFTYLDVELQHLVFSQKRKQDVKGLRSWWIKALCL